MVGKKLLNMFIVLVISETLYRSDHKKPFVRRFPHSVSA